MSGQIAKIRLEGFTEGDRWSAGAVNVYDDGTMQISLTVGAFSYCESIDESAARSMIAALESAMAYRAEILKGE